MWFWIATLTWVLKFTVTFGGGGATGSMIAAGATFAAATASGDAEALGGVGTTSTGLAMPLTDVVTTGGFAVVLTCAWLDSVVVTADYRCDVETAEDDPGPADVVVTAELDDVTAEDGVGLAEVITALGVVIGVVGVVCTTRVGWSVVVTGACVVVTGAWVVVTGAWVVTGGGS
jgi:hypothetical protein